MKNFHMIAWILLLVGGLNWLLVGLGGFLGGSWNIVYLVFGSFPVLEWLIYVLVGLAAVYEIFTHKKNCRSCGSGGAPTM